ncbi:porin family protein [Acidobacteria bacterium AH-259-L09]|nr:porin family protein [Acidobacteria bacterium AH-259-L09]
MSKMHRTVKAVFGVRLAVCLMLLTIGSLMTPTVSAQRESRVEVFGGHSILRPNLPGGLGRDPGTGDAVEKVGEFLLNNVLGWGASVTVNFNGTLGITADFGGHYRSLDVTADGTRVDASADLHSFLFGPKVTFGGERVKPFVRALFGVSHVTGSVRLDSESADFDDNVFTAAAGAGLDVRVNSKIAVRLIEFDYFPVRRGNGETFTFNNVRWRTGVVFLFGQ